MIYVYVDNVAIGVRLGDDERLRVVPSLSGTGHVDVAVVSGSRRAIAGVPTIAIAIDGPNDQPLPQGLAAYLPPDVTGAELASAIMAAASGFTVLTQAQSQKWLRRRTAPDEFPQEELTARELEVLRIAADGLANKDIAAHLHISTHTVKFHIAQVLAKLGAGSRTEAVSLAIRRGLIPI